MESFIGCSGYYYNHWKNLFYPEELPKNKWLIFYSEHFNTVEINNTFYRMPSESAVKNWHSITPGDFVFSVKGYRYFTHLRKLIIDDAFMDYLAKFMHLVALLKEKTGPLLWQFPGSFRADVVRFESFCRILSSGFVHVFEFRHESWFNEEIFGILEKYRHSLCIISGPRNIPVVVKTTSPTAYIRFHGEGSWYSDNYSNDALDAWKNKLSILRADRLFAYFNNDVNGYAVNNAEYLKSLYAKEPSLLK
ncbi:MAG: DUF72 domain-containing protein [Chloroflexota bacterium]